MKKSQNPPRSPQSTNQVVTTKSKKAQQNRQRWIWFGVTAVVLISATAGILLALIGTKPLMKSQVNPNRTGSAKEDSISGTGLSFTQLARPVNLLILGIDNDDNFARPHLSTKSTSVEAFSNPSNTMLLVRFLPDPHQIHILSIPRDTLVQLPGIPAAKIDWANLVGGAPLAIKTVSRQLGNLPIDHYLRLSRNGFIELVDALGGVEVNVPKKMDYVDQTQQLNIHFLPGKQKLNGRHLEEYVRFRHDKLGDIGRVQRQQEVIKAMMQTLLQPMTIAKLPQILQVTQANIDTDLSVEEMLTLVHHSLTSDRLRNNFLMLPGRFSQPHEYPRSYWIPDPKAAALILARYFDVNPRSTPLANTKLAPNQLKVAVANATGKPELGTNAIALLKKQGFTRAYLTDNEIGTSADSALTTQIIAQRGNSEDASVVKEALGIGQVLVTATGDIWSDITVVIGADASTQFSP